MRMVMIIMVMIKDEEDDDVCYMWEMGIEDAESPDPG